MNVVWKSVITFALRTNVKKVANPVLSRTRLHFFQNPKIINVWPYRYHYWVPSFIFVRRCCNVILCPSSHVASFKSNQYNHCSVSTDVFEWNCRQTGKTSEVCQLTSLARMTERVKIIHRKEGNTTSMAKHISYVHQIKAKCSAFNCLWVEDSSCLLFSCRTTDGPVLIIHTSTSGNRTHRHCP